MKTKHLTEACAVIPLVLVATGAVAATHAPRTDAQEIRSAVSAAPAEVGNKATVVKLDENGAMQTLREGSNEFTCMADNPATPGPDPMCLDKNAMAWAEAWVGHKTPPAGKTGLMYMLAGGTDASNVDPYAAQPSEANHWLKTGPHIMIVSGDPSFYAQYPRSADPNTKMPYVMWANTPYEHLMVPVK